MKRKIVMMGTSLFAVPILNSLFKNNKIDLICVYTSSSERVKSPVELYCNKNDIPLRHVEKKFSEEEVNFLSNLHLDAIVVASYGVILRSNVLNCTRYGCINVHPSALPRWRGAAPIRRSIMAGEKETDVCIMKMDEGVDTGPVLMRRPVAIDEGKVHSEIEEELSNMGAQMLNEVLEDLPNITEKEQSSIGSSLAKKILREEERIDWRDTAENIHNKIRALSFLPGAYTFIADKRVKILKSIFLDDLSHNDNKPGTVITNDLGAPMIVCGDGRCIKPVLLQREGRNRIGWEDFMRGEKIMKYGYVFDEA